MAESQNLSAFSDCTTFLEFANDLNIPINQEYFNHIDDEIESVNFNLGVIDVGVKDCKTHKNLNERRIQNALWRAWWRQRSTCFHSGKKRHPNGKERHLEKMNLLWGSSIGDIPTEYVIPDDLEDHELPVIGTYVDRKIIPGFSYRVRVCGNKDKNFLFDGKALRLDRVGAGYGKRLTFEDEDILDGDNFFWSDSNPDGGYAFSVKVINEGQRFKVVDSLDRGVGEVIVAEVDSRQKIISSRMEDLETILEVRVGCKICFMPKDGFAESPLGNMIPVSGTAKMRKTPQSKIAILVEISGVTIQGFGHCVLSRVI